MEFPIKTEVCMIYGPVLTPEPQLLDLGPV